MAEHINPVADALAELNRVQAERERTLTPPQGRPWSAWELDALRKLADAVRESTHRPSPATWTWDEIRTALDTERAAWAATAKHTRDIIIAGEVLDGIEGRLAEQVRARGYRNGPPDGNNPVTGIAYND